MIDTKTKFVLFFNALYLSIASLFVFQKTNYEFVIYIAVVFIVLFFVAWMHLKFSLSTPVLWLMSVWGLVHMSGGLVLIPEHWPRGAEGAVLYNWWVIGETIKYDQLVHAYGFGVTTWLIWQVLCKTIVAKTNCAIETIRPTFGLLFLCVVASMGLGALNEVIEFFAVLAVPETNVGGYINTGWDLVYNMAGAIIVAILIYTIRSRR